MQPMAVITSSVSGMVYLNGRFAGETPLYAPVSAWGALYIELRPFAEGYLPMSRRLTLSNGRVIAGADGVYIVAWGRGVIEMELIPRAQATAYETLDGLAIAYAGAEPPYIENGVLHLPRGSNKPISRRINEHMLFTGEAGGAHYAVCMSDILLAESMEVASDGLIRAFVKANDIAGHATLEMWRSSANGLELISAESAWADGNPHWAQTPEQTALAAAEAHFAGLHAEAEGYLAPPLMGAGLWDKLLSGYYGVTPMKYAAPDDRPAIGLLSGAAENAANVTPLYYAASPMGGTQGAWRLESVSF